MRVLSLYDGISCGMLALLRAGIHAESYDAFEIDKYAVQISGKNFPEIKHHGNVFDGDFTKFKGYDLLLGGSPCTYWSIAKAGRETTPDGIGGKLFMEYVRALRESGCKYFLYENNYSIHKNIKAFISEQLGVEPIMINSALVSAQQRKRCYWTNIPDVIQPEDKGIMLKDILEDALAWQDKSYCITSSYGGAVIWNTLERKQRTMVAEPVGAAQRGRYVESGGRSHKCEGGTQQCIELRNDCKSNCLTTVQKDSLVAIPVDTESIMPVREATQKGYAEIKAGECVDLTMPNSETRRGRKMSEKSNCLTTSCEYYEYLGEIKGEPIPINTYRNEGEKSRTVMAGYYKYGEANLLREKGFKGGSTAVAAPVRLGHFGKASQGQRIYSVHGKSVTICSGAGGLGSKTGLYKIDLPDGDYLIRKLTPVEAERLQTLPDNYTEGISKTQRYKCIGNGWTVDVIAHILSNLKGKVE